MKLHQKAPPMAALLRELQLGQGTHAALGHVDEGAGIFAAPQGVLYTAQEVVGFEEKQHLTWDVVEELSYL